MDGLVSIPDAEVCQISLTHGYYAVVDLADYQLVSGYKWHAMVDGGNRVYARTRWKKHRKVLMHRLIMDAPRGVCIDHRDGDGLNNRRSNLRFCTKSQNLANTKKNRNNTSSRFKGVCWHKATNKWCAIIAVDEMDVHLGLFENELDAAIAYNKAAIIYFGEFARGNEI